MRLAKDNLESAKACIDFVLREIDRKPSMKEKLIIQEIIKKCVEIDEKYKNHCMFSDNTYAIQTLDIDIDSYKNGLDSEFEIDGCLWHEISVLLRSLNLDDSREPKESKQ